MAMHAKTNLLGTFFVVATTALNDKKNKLGENCRSVRRVAHRNVPFEESLAQLNRISEAAKEKKPYEINAQEVYDLFFSWFCHIEREKNVPV